METFIALAILFGTGDVSDDTPGAVKDAFYRVAEEMEIRSDTWRNYYFRYDVEECRRRVAVLRECPLPPIAAAAVLPPRELTLSWWQTSGKIRQHLEAAAEYDPVRRDAILDALRADQRRHEALDALDNAASTSCDVFRRRMELRRLMDLIGPEAFEARCWPCAVPLHLMRRLD